MAFRQRLIEIGLPGGSQTLWRARGEGLPRQDTAIRQAARVVHEVQNARQTVIDSQNRK